MSGQLVYHPLRARLLQVRRVDALSPRLRRITLGGPALDGFISPAPDDHVRLIFPAAGQKLPVLPTIGPQGVAFPPDAPKPPTRDYTPRAFDAQRQELVLDFVLHGDGPASTWAAAAAVGDFLGVAGPRASRCVDAAAHSHWLLLGDETALPAIARWLEWIPQQHHITARIEVESPEDRIALPAHAGLDLAWVQRRPPAQGCALLAAVCTLPLVPGYAWIATESAQMRGLRQHLLTERGWPRDHLHAAGYWKRGRPDHDDEH